MNKPNNDTKTTPLTVTNFTPLNRIKQKTLQLSDFQKQIIFGRLLGDAYLQTINNGKTYRLRIQQNSSKHGEYVLHGFDNFKDFCCAPPSRVERKKNNTMDIRFQTVAHKEFVDFGKRFYANDAKIIPSNQDLEKWLTPVAFAYWYMDDGGIETANPNACSINTHSFAENDVDRLIQVLNNKYELKAYGRTNKKAKIIIIPAKSRQTMRDLLTDRVVPCMRYKIP